jgi:hypothetical protein
MGCLLIFFFLKVEFILVTKALLQVAAQIFKINRVYIILEIRVLHFRGLFQILAQRRCHW